MAGRLGMDVEQAFNVAKLIKNMVQGFENQFKTMTNQVKTGFEWEGTDSNKFRTNWESEVQRQFFAITQLVYNEAGILEKEAVQQAEVSGSPINGGRGDT